MTYKFADIIESKILARLNEDGAAVVNADDFLNRYRGRFYSRTKNPDGFELRYSKVSICNEYLAVAAAITARTGRINIAAIKRELHVGYARAKEIIEELKQNHLIGDYDHKIRAHGYTPTVEDPAKEAHLEVTIQDHLAQNPAPVPVDPTIAQTEDDRKIVPFAPPALPVVRKAPPIILRAGEQDVVLSEEPDSGKKRWLAHAAGFAFAMIASSALAFSAYFSDRAPRSVPADRNVFEVSLADSIPHFGKTAGISRTTGIFSIGNNAAASIPEAKPNDMEQRKKVPLPVSTSDVKMDTASRTSPAAAPQTNLVASNLVAVRASFSPLHLTESLSESALARHNRLCGERDGNPSVQARLAAFEGGPYFNALVANARLTNNLQSADAQRAALIVNVAAGLETMSNDKDVAGDANDVCKTDLAVRPQEPKGPFSPGTIRLADAVQTRLENGQVANFSNLFPPAPYGVKVGLGQYEINKYGWEKLGANIEDAFKIAEYRISMKSAALAPKPTDTLVASAAPARHAPMVTRFAP